MRRLSVWSRRGIIAGCGIGRLVTPLEMTLYRDFWHRRKRGSPSGATGDVK
ncbi:hypothetical protein KCP69_03770 [Salmonella enterica subsp. enterica]|nr:hypothetical protein KCP69_03770 [Salmonella enterica subsp. enterica]